MSNQQDETMSEPIDHADLLDMTADIVSAFVSKNTVRASELSELIAAVHHSLATIAAPKPAEEPIPELRPAVPVKKSITDDYLICLDDGKKFKSLRRHLAQLGMTPEQYRAKWDLPRDYPMVAPGYAAKRSELAKLSGLGSSRRLSARTNDSVDDTALSPVEEEDEATLAPVIDQPEPAAPTDEAQPKRRGRGGKKAA